jgi:hypothetical protein
MRREEVGGSFVEGVTIYPDIYLDRGLEFSRWP